MGKTLSMLNDSVSYMERGVEVVSNVPFRWTGKGGKQYSVNYLGGKEFERSFMEKSNALFLVDEASIVLPNYYWNKMGGDLLMRFAQSRKYGLDIFYTSQGYTHAVKRLRDLTNEVVKCEKLKIFGVTVFRNLVYDPEFFNQRIITSLQIEKKYILSRKFITGARIKKLYSSFDTMWKVQSSMLTEITKGDSNFEGMDL